MTRSSIPDGRKDAEWQAAAAPPHERLTEDADDLRTMALLAWALMLAGVVTFLAALAGVVVAYAKRGAAPEPWRSHFDRVIRCFWIWLLLNIVGAPLILLFGLGYLVLAVAAIWLAATGVVCLVRAAENRPA